jgi:hypothetical protein
MEKSEDIFRYIAFDRILCFRFEQAESIDVWKMVNEECPDLGVAHVTKLPSRELEAVRIPRIDFWQRNRASYI